MSRLTALALLALSACGERIDPRWTLQDDGVVLVREHRQTTTRTPRGIEDVTLDMSQLWRVTQPGVLGEDAVAWREEVTTWTVTYTDLAGTYTWTLGSGEPLSDTLLALGPPQPREIFVSADGTVRVSQQPVVAPEPVEPPPTRRGRAAPEPARVPWTENNRVHSWVVGFTHAPDRPVRKGTAWSWQASREVTPRTTATTTTRWELLGTQAERVMLRETIQLEGSPPPSEGHFQTTGLSGGADLRLDARTHALLSYTSRYDADIASPSSRGTALRISEITMEVQ